MTPTRSILLLACLLPMLAQLPRLGAEEEFQLVSGDVIVGTVVRETEKEVEISQQVLVDNRPAQSSFVVEKSQIVKRVTVPSLLEQYQERVGKVEDTVDGQCVLAAWCWEHGLVDQAEAHALKAESLNGKDPKVAALFAQLGCVKDQGQWIRQADGSVVTDKAAAADEEKRKAQAKELAKDLAKDLAKATAERDELKKKFKELDRTQIDLSKKVEEAEKKARALASQVIAQMEKKANLEAIEKGNVASGASDEARKYWSQADTDRMRKRIEDDQAAVTQANAELKKLEHDRDQAQQKLSPLQASLSKLAPEIAALRFNLSRAEKEVAKLQAAVEKANPPGPGAAAPSAPGGAPAAGGANPPKP
jgi:DNA repair exonuclease SbcCD ATPase subunit